MTVEAALAISSIVVVVVLCLGALMTVTAHIRCVDAAREGARLSAVGDGAAEDMARRVAPPGARVEIGVSEGVVTVRVASPAPLPGVDVSAVAYAAMEPDVDEFDSATADAVPR